MKILFLHGWQSVPGGVKPTYLAQHGHQVINPGLPDDDFDAAVRIAQAEFDKHQPQVVVGSSRGGAVAMNIDNGHAGLVLLCPAWKKFGTATTVKPEAIILHSRADDVVPFADTKELVKNSGCALIEVGNDHRLADPESLEMMLGALGKGTGMTLKKRRLWLLAVPIYLVIVVLIWVLFFQLRSGIRVAIENSGPTLLKSVVLHVTGASHSLGDIAPGASAATTVKPTGESHLEIQFEEADGQAQRLNAGGYFESGYRGTIRVSIKDGEIDKNEQNVNLW